MKPARHANKTRQGFTLIEVLLVLTVMLALSLVVVPSVVRMYDSFRMSSVSQTVRTELAGCRFKAIESGLPYQFRFEPSGTHFLVLPYEQVLVDENEESVSDADVLFKFFGSVPDDLRFEYSTEAETSGEQLSADLFAGLEHADLASGINWSGPILFYADGSAEEFQIRLLDESDLGVKFSVRALTGAVSLKTVREAITQ